jgi:bifunctional DNA-binding transcriptional regulator/antitoxin component of YhaV-PrlF toxin-antitoxin module
MPVVAVKNKYQGVIPQRLREELSIHRGDLLEATREDAPGWLKKIWQASLRQTDHAADQRGNRRCPS